MPKIFIQLFLVIAMLFACSFSVNARSVKEEALDLYKQRKYLESMPLLRLLVKQNKQDDHLRAKYAYALYKVRNYKLAKVEFEYILRKSKHKSLQAYSKKILKLIANKWVPTPDLTPEIDSPVAIPSLQPTDSVIVIKKLELAPSEESGTVEELIQTIHKQEKLTEIVPYLNHDSATMLSFNLIFGLQFMSQFKHMIPDEGKRQRFMLLDAELNKLLQRFEIVHLSRESYEGPFDKIKPMGRTFLKELANLLETYEDKSGQAKSKLKQFKEFKVSNLNLEKLDKERVRITFKKGQKEWEAHKKNGLWKLHMGGIEALRKTLSQ